MRNYDLDDDDDAIIKQLMKDRPIASLGNSKLGDKPAVPVANEDASLFTVGEYASIAEATMASRIPATPTAVTGRGVGGQSDQVTPTEQVSASALAAAARAAKQKALEKRLKETFGLGTKEENLGTNFFLTPWVAPAFDRADEFRRSQLFRRGDTEGGNISLVSSPDLGLGVRLYFQFLISMSIGLAAMFVLSLPLLLFSAFSSGMPPQSRDAAGLYRFGLGNMGYQGPAAYNNFISEPHVCDRARYAASDQTCVSVVGFEFSLRQVHLTLTGCEFLQVVVLLLVVRHLQNRLERLCRPDKAENLVSITHYAVYVDNLPPFVTAEEVIAHFSALYQLQNVDWRDRLPVEDARPVQSVDNSGLQMHAGSWVAECTLYRRVGPLLRELILGCFAERRHPERGVALGRLILFELTEAEDPATFIPMPQDPRARRVAELVLAEPDGIRDLEDLATIAGTSARTVTRLFSQETSLSFRTWRQRARIMAAIEALGGQNPPTMKDLAHRLGFSSTAAFDYAFKQVTGTTPTAFMGKGGG